MRGIISVRVKVSPDARRERVLRRSDTALAVSVREPAQGNQANDRVRQIVAEMYKVPLAHVRLQTGARSPSKLYKVVLVDK